MDKIAVINGPSFVISKWLNHHDPQPRGMRHFGWRKREIYSAGRPKNIQENFPSQDHFHFPHDLSLLLHIIQLITLLCVLEVDHICY